LVRQKIVILLEFDIRNSKNKKMRKKIKDILLTFLKLIGINRIDRYIIGKFLSTYFFLIVIIITIAIIFDYNEKIDKFTQSGVSFQKIIFDFYFNFIPYFINLFSPLFVFIAVIFFTSKLADNSEIIAMKAAGISFKRLLRPYMYSAILIGAMTFVLGAYVIPKGNVSRVNFENTYLKKKKSSIAENVQLQVAPGVVAYITQFDNETKRGFGFSLDKFVNKQLVSRLTANIIRYDTLAEKRYSWSVQQYTLREFKGMKEQITNGAHLDTIINMEPSDFFYINNQQETMTLPQLDEFVEKQANRGAAGVSTFEVEYHKRFASPFAAIILTVIGVSLSSQKRKGGMGASIGVGLALSFTYILLQSVASTFATNAGWPPMLAVWLPNILFSIIAFYLYKRTPQ